MSRDSNEDPFDPFASDQERQEMLQYQMLKSRQNVLVLAVVGGLAIVIFGILILSNQLPFLALNII